MIGKNSQKNSYEKASARVVDGKLILSLPAANTPVVWQMDLGHAKASALEVRHNKEAEIFTLTLKTHKGETMEIAAFNERDRSIEGLMAASRALESAHGQIKFSGANDSAPAPVVYAAATEAEAPKKGRAVFFVLALLVLFGAFMLWSAQMPALVAAPPSSGASMGAGAQAPVANGIPLSADAFLQSQ
jgi:hypothetical protein